MSQPFVIHRRRSLPIWLLAASLLLCSVALPVLAADPDPEDASHLIDDGIGAPFRVRDYTFPSFLVLGFAPTPAAPLGKGNWAIEMHGSLVNDFQASESVETYLAETRGGERGRRPLDATDVEAILAMPEGQAFYIDGEFNFFDVVMHYGLTDRLDLGVSLYSIGYTGGTLDSSIFDVHDKLGYGQQGRDFVADDQFQLVFGDDDLDPLVALERPAAGGWSDPSIYLRYGFPRRTSGWRYAMVIGAKAPLADQTESLSTGSWDFGAQLTAERRGKYNAFLLNISLVRPGDFRQNGLELPLLPSAHLTFMHRFKRFPNTRIMLQALIAEHPFRDLVDSALTELETQLTLAIKWNTPMGVLGLGLTENLFNMDNTPDIGLHVSWGLLLRGDRKPKATAAGGRG